MNKIPVHFEQNTKPGLKDRARMDAFDEEIDLQVSSEVAEEEEVPSNPAMLMLCYVMEELIKVLDEFE